MLIPNAQIQKLKILLEKENGGEFSLEKTEKAGRQLIGFGGMRRGTAEAKK
jgi:hypothetical protein